MASQDVVVFPEEALFFGEPGRKVARTPEKSFVTSRQKASFFISP